MSQFSHAYSGGVNQGGGPSGRRRKVELEYVPPAKQQGKPMQVQKAKSGAAKSISTRRAKIA